MKISFYAGSCIPIHAQSLDQRPMGGTEVGLIRVAEILQQRGHDVTVFTSLRNPPPSSPRYLYQDEVLRSRDTDVLIIVQNIEAAFHQIPYKRLFFWCGDGPEQFANFGLGDARVAERLEKSFFVSSWQRDVLCEVSGFPSEKSIIVGNGVHLPHFQGTELRRRKRILYASAPYRGLDLVPAIYREIKMKHPDAELAVFAGMKLYDRDQPFEGPERDLERKLIPILQQLPDCLMSEPVPQHQLAREYMKSSVLLYPNTVLETCCMVALEAIAGGCPVVTGHNSGLVESVGDCGITIKAEPGTPQYSKLFIDAVDTLLSDDNYWSDLVERSIKRGREELSWEKVADRIEAELAKNA